MVSGDLPQSSRNLQDCKKVLQKLTYLHQSRSLLTHSCPSQRRGKPEKSPSPVVQIKVMLREKKKKISWKAIFFKTLALYNCSFSWARNHSQQLLWTTALGMAFLTRACWLLEAFCTEPYMRQQSPTLLGSSKETIAAVPDEIQCGKRTDQLVSSGEQSRHWFQPHHISSLQSLLRKNSTIRVQPITSPAAVRPRT